MARQTRSDQVPSSACTCPYNEFVAAGVQKVIDAALQNKNANLNIITTYKKALQSIQKSPIPIKSIDDIKRLKYVGTYLSVEIQKVIRSHGLTLLPSTQPQVEEWRVSDDPAKKARKTAATREYIPRFQSGAYAILIAMVKEDRIFRKGELIIAAQPYSELSLTAVNVNGSGSNFYNAWSGMATLINKELVLKSGSPSRYELSDSGRKLGQALLQNLAKKRDGSDASLRQPAQLVVQRTISNVSAEISEFEVILIIDTAEQFRENRNKVAIDFQNQNLSAQRARLSIGDYCWVVKPTSSSGLVGASMLPFIVERKKDADLSGSIRDMRYEEQKFRLSQAEVNVIYILEGDPHSGNLVDPKSVLSAISRMTAHDGFFVYQTIDLESTIRLLSSIHKGLMQKVAKEGVPENAELFFVFNDRLEKSCIPDKSHQFGTLLMALTGVSSYRCEAIIAKYPSLHALLVAYDRCSSVAEEEKLLESIEFLSKGLSKTKMGIAVSKKIRAFFRDCSYTSKCSKKARNDDDSVIDTSD